MRQDSRYRNDMRSDYMQFSQFLENAKMAREGGTGGCCDRTGTDYSAGNSCGRSRSEGSGTTQCPVGMVYGVSQKWTDIYETDVGFSRGTIFKALDLPFYRTGCNDKGGCRG